MPGLTHILGDIVISVPMAQKQARGLGHSLGDELIVLAIHGFLHLLGLDHERDGNRGDHSGGMRNGFSRFDRRRYRFVFSGCSFGKR